MNASAPPDWSPSAIPLASSDEGAPASLASFYFELVVHGFLMTSVGCVGLVNNVLCMLVLRQPTMHKNVDCLLVGLASTDLLLVLAALLMFSLPVMADFVNAAEAAADISARITPIVYPVAMIVQTASVYLTMAVTLERYLVVCRPLRARSLCTLGRARKCVGAVCVAAILYNATRFAEYRTEESDLEMTSEAVNRSDAPEDLSPSALMRRTVLVATSLRQNPVYITVYINSMYMLFMYVVPFAVLLALNVRIIGEIRRARRTRSTMSRAQANEQRTAIMLAVVVAIFVVCNAPAMVSNIMECFDVQAVQLTQVSNLLVVINSSVNLFIYCALGTKFRRVFLRVVLRRKADSRLHMVFSKRRAANVELKTLGPRRAPTEGNGAAGSSNDDEADANSTNSQSRGSSGFREKMFRFLAVSSSYSSSTSPEASAQAGSRIPTVSSKCSSDSAAAASPLPLALASPPLDVSAGLSTAAAIGRSVFNRSLKVSANRALHLPPPMGASVDSVFLPNST